MGAPYFSLLIILCICTWAYYLPSCSQINFSSWSQRTIISDGKSITVTTTNKAVTLSLSIEDSHTKSVIVLQQVCRLGQCRIKLTTVGFVYLRAYNSVNVSVDTQALLGM